MESLIDFGFLAICLRLDFLVKTAGSETVILVMEVSGTSIISSGSSLRMLTTSLDSSVNTLVNPSSDSSMGEAGKGGGICCSGNCEESKGALLLDRF